MALFQVDFFSKSLAGVMDFKVILPNDTVPEMVQGNPHYKRSAKTLFLLHGYSGSSKDWLTGSRIEELAGKYNLAVVMPSCRNSFYLDGKGTGNAYCQYVGKELVEYVRKTFGIAGKREDTYIGGLSMGGFGAIHTGLVFPDTFEKIVALSPALIIHNIENMKEGDKDFVADYYYYASVFGDLDKLENSPNNPEFLIRKLKKEGKRIPPIFRAIGTEDFLIEPNRAFAKFLKEENVPETYIESPGVHNWDFWNAYLEKSIKWLLE
ncbi:alpha/beta hydrolase-fold protein [[Clostridium] cellulosi]